MAASNVVAAGRRQGALVLQCQVCGAQAEATCESCARNFEAAHAHPERTHLGLGDVVAAGIKRLLGIKPCSACERRQAALNRAVPRVMRRR